MKRAKRWRTVAPRGRRLRKLCESHKTNQTISFILMLMNEEVVMRSARTKKHQTPPCSNQGISYSLGSPLTCQRCQGLLVREFCMDIHDGTGENGFWAARCLQCGELLDPLILHHRTSRPEAALAGRSRQQLPVALS